MLKKCSKLFKWCSKWCSINIRERQEALKIKAFWIGDKKNETSHSRITICF